MAGLLFAIPPTAPRALEFSCILFGYTSFPGKMAGLWNRETWPQAVAWVIISKYVRGIGSFPRHKNVPSVSGAVLSVRTGINSYS